MAKKYLEGTVVMGSEDATTLTNYVDLHMQPVRRLQITVEVLDKNLNVLETIEGLTTSGSVAISNSSLVRRTGSLSFIMFDYLLPRKSSLLWMTNRIRVYVGIENIASSIGAMTHFCLGTFYITEPTTNITLENRTISISLEDNMMRWESVELDAKLVFEAGTPLHTAMSQLMNYFGEWNTKIDFTDLTIPYKLEYPEGTNIQAIIQALRDLYMDWECYYDIEGTFVFRKMDIQRVDGEKVAWRFGGETNHLLNHSETFSYKNVRNRVLVIGAMDELTGLTPRAEAVIIDKDSPFHENEIGVKKKVIADTSLGTVDQCDAKARYELFKQSTLQEQLTLSSIPVFFLDGNDIIEVENPVTKEVNRYIIDSIDIPLAIGGEMGIQSHKLYYDLFNIQSTLDEYKETADVVEDGINNKGWLSIAEKRIGDYLGIYGSGSKLIVRFENGMLHGTTAYVTAYLSGETTQVLTVDLADFKSFGENGDTGQGKAEYSDRILGHEMLHVIMNDTYSAEKVSEMPNWFKEGLGEFIHGADERLKLSIVEAGSISDTKLTSLLNSAEEMLNTDAWSAVSDSYSAGYLIIKYLDKKMLSGKDWKTFMKAIKDAPSNGDSALKSAIVSHTGFANYDAFITSFVSNAKTFVKNSITLNPIGDEIDTGSIGGSDHRGSVPLNAENIFDNSSAVKGVALKNFVVEFDKP